MYVIFAFQIFVSLATHEVYTEVLYTVRFLSVCLLLYLFFCVCLRLSFSIHLPLPPHPSLSLLPSPFLLSSSIPPPFLLSSSLPIPLSLPPSTCKGEKSPFRESLPPDVVSSTSCLSSPSPRHFSVETFTREQTAPVTGTAPRLDSSVFFLFFLSSSVCLLFP